MWEIAQLPLYTIWHEAAAAFIAFAVVHCLIGDVLITAAIYIAAAAALRDVNWPFSKPVRGILIVLPLSVLYTGWSEWYNVYRAGGWTYSPIMPLLFGVGVSPLLQWIVVPIVSLIWMTRAQPWCDQRE